MIDKLEMFLAVAKERHFGRAATSLGITQPTLSAGIKQLEEQLGVLLIFRGSRFGGLTPEGQAALIWARRIVGDSRQLREEMRATRHGLSGRLRIAVIPTALTWAARISARFGRAHPNVAFTILSRNSVEILQMIDDLDVDAGISYLDNEPLGKVSTVPLYDERYMLVCDPGSDLAGRDRVAWADLDGQRLCLLTSDMQNRRIINRNLSAAGVTPQASVESGSTVVLVSHVVEGGWVTILPEDIAAFLGHGKNLRLIPLEKPQTIHAVGLVAPWREPHTPVLEALLAEARRLVVDR
ncbi:MAG: LysR family transcriptional regulator [Paracoccus sp. (in: a-proteobacteria)]|uniref:LysR family transcriptional regulator n=1 Tax=unclassified Paracoccus (in: a-proteobacteria) TaxID=2688777 RepID=UPI000C39FB9F|nr:MULTISPECIES: LysR family transcriptional regulator [unclassified Paracoccus (in: a-proteobacteria)]MBA48910.1 LysR family transcriptional regulator [Paracoccus sp. (in: a-proteobacteria)]HIC65530.1 LysR family transcriptional regulator [Paracoccus sp. (in: a-proteobacteria)]